MTILRYAKGDFRVLRGKFGATECLVQAKPGDTIVAYTQFQKEVLEAFAKDHKPEVKIILESEFDPTNQEVVYCRFPA